MNLLLNKLPTSIIVQGEEYPIDTNFRSWIKFELQMLNTSSTNENKMTCLLALMNDVLPSDMESCISALGKFYQCGEEEGTVKKKSYSKQRIYDYEIDQFLIYTAFIQYYKIDLNTITYLHWWTFKQLFIELPDEAKIKKVMLYRSLRIHSNMSKEQKQFYADMKILYALPDSRSEKQKATNFGAVLANGILMEEG